MKTAMELVFAIEPDLVANALCSFTLNFFNGYESQKSTVTWQDVELAVYLVLIFGEVCKGIVSSLLCAVKH